MQREMMGETMDIVRAVVEVVARNPNLSAAVAALFVALILGGLWWHLRPSVADRFVDALADRERVAVLMHPNPDPDAMACAMGVAALADSVNTDAVVQYPGEIRHPENRAFETVLDCGFDRIEKAEDLATGDIVLVDHNEPRGFDGAEVVEPYAIVDHHPGNAEGSAFTDVRTDRGSCASVLTEYIYDRGWSNGADGRDGRSLTPSLATALLYGIQSDTTSFSRSCTPAEFDAAAYLFPAADSDSLDRIANPQIDNETLDVKARAITSRKLDGSFLLSHVGSLSNLDALPVAAEELVRLEGVTATVVTGEHEGTLHVSGRSRDDRVHMGKSISKALKPIPEASAGGHARMGGGQATLSEGDGTETGELHDRFFAAMNGRI